MAMQEHPVTDYEALVSESVQLVDVREPDEFAQGSLPNAIHIPLGEIPARMDELDASKRTLVLCHAGGRSARAGEFLSQNGFSEVVNLAGGMSAWNDRPGA